MTVRTRTSSILVAAIAAASLLALSAAPAAADFEAEGQDADELEAGEDYVRGELLVRFKDGISDKKERRFLRKYGKVEEDLDEAVDGLVLVDLSKGKSVEKIEEKLEDAKRVKYVEPNVKGETTAIPNDPLFGELYGLLNQGQAIEDVPGIPGADIAATTAWDTTIGSRNIVVGVYDTGVNPAHVDLAPNLAPGYDFENNRPQMADTDGHGTHVAGTIGAAGNDGIGVIGVSPLVTMVPMRSRFTADEFIQATAFAAEQGVRVFNGSFKFAGCPNAARNAIGHFKQMLFVFAAGNDSSNNDGPNPVCPASWPNNNIISVAATDNRDQLADFSNFGANRVDLAAPGKDIFSAAPAEPGYKYESGTSMASPHVAGAAALVLSIRPGLAPAQLKAVLLNSVDIIPGLQGAVRTSGRLNLARALVTP
jgi:subtilisin family serine protease